MARKENFHVWALLGERNKECFREKEVQVIKDKKNGNPKEKTIILVKFDSENKFLSAHLDEINRCYTHKGYTVSFMLIRKVIEFLITEIIKIKFPEKTKEHRGIYLDFSYGRIRDLSELIKNLRDIFNSFDPEEKNWFKEYFSYQKDLKMMQMIKHIHSIILAVNQN